MVTRSHWLGLLLLACSFGLQAAVDSHINRSSVSQGESIRFTIDMSDIDGDNINLNPLQKDFEILGRSQQSRTVITNGSLQSTNELVLSLLPRRTGVLTIPALEIDGEQTQSHQIEVTAVAQPAAAEGGLEMSATLSSETPLVQQPLIYRMQLKVGRAVFNASLQPPAIAAGKALVESLGEQEQFKQRINGREITVVEQAWLITPEQSGELEISPASMVAQVRTGRRNRDAFGSSLFSDPYETRRVQISADGFSLQVAPIPADYSARYWLPAGSLNLKEQWSSDQFRAGEPLTRSITLTVEGLAVNQLPELTLPESDGLKQYAANPVTDQGYQDGVLRSSLTQEVTLIPGRAGEMTLPAVEIPWWNTRSGRIEVARLPARTLDVAAAEGEVATVPQPQSQPQQQRQAQSPVPAVTAADTATDIATDTTEQPSVAAAAETEAAVVAGADPVASLWIALAGALAGSALTLLGLWGWRRWRREGTASVAASVPSSRPSPQAVIKACQSDNAAAAREALLQWAQGYWPEVNNLHQLSARVSPELQRAIAELNRSSYSRSPRAWQGERLISAIKAFDPEKQNGALKDSALEPLYR
ncbi:BatD family protein [Marinobacterium jannaschii]|uniref:BatD family protein n=1 Tax=Marinobacterium jannaschii TaxID=64970 RepID=UPI0004846AC1|nr:BatD family protein [Marinobacterium jannaschii]